MNVTEFVQDYQRKFQDFCACILEEDGNLIPCEKGHLQTMQELYLKRHPKEELPAEATALFWLTVQMKVVVVDYENQVYSNELTKEQKQVLKTLKQEKLIEIHLANIHDHTD